MAKQTKKETSPVEPGEVQNETTVPKDTAELEAQKAAELETQKQAELEAQKQAELETQKQAELEAQKQAELEAQKQAELEAQKQAELEAQKQAELDTQKQAELEAQKQAEAKERTALGYHEYNGRKYTFTASMPNRVNLDGVILSKKEILSNPDVMEAMIDSKNIFIKEI